MKQLPGQYVLSKFYTYAGEPVFRKFDGNYNASCNICKEGKSWLKKKRLFYYPSSNTFYCFNCSKSYTAWSYIKISSGLSIDEIKLEANQENNSLDITKRLTSNSFTSKERPVLPHDSVNLLDLQQQNYFKDNIYFKKALQYLTSRRLNSAVNRSSHYYISFTDYFHQNRLCIPYFSRNSKIEFYQTRALDESEPRYLNKIGCDKTIFGAERIKTNLEFIFIFEGPVDAMFVQNGTCLAGLTLNNTQLKQLSEFPFHEKIWVLDNPNKDQAAKEKIKDLLLQKEKVFRWPLNSPFKDFNEWALSEGTDEIPYDMIVNSLYQF